MRLPQQVGDYELTDHLGSGGFGAVYRARIRGELGFSQEVAVKLVADAQVDDRPGVLTALADEAHFLSRIAHPHIVAVRRFTRVEHEFLGGVHVLEMELVRGLPLGRLLERVRDARLLLPAESTLSLLLEAADALRYAHELKDDEGRPAGLVHRDLKPDNLLVSDDGRLKVLDFGIAWAEDRMATNTETGVAKGTLLYMSPEQARGKRVDARSDLFSLGAIAFELLTGEMYVPLPPSGERDVPQLIWAMSKTRWEDRSDRLRQALRAPRPAGHGLDADAAELLVDVLGGLLPEDPDARFPHASRLLQRLERLATGWNLPLGRRYLRTACTVTGGGEPELRSGDDVELETATDEQAFDAWTQTLVAGDASPFPPTGVPSPARDVGPTLAGPRPPTRRSRTPWVVAVALGAALLFALWPRPEPASEVPAGGADEPVVEATNEPPADATIEAPASTEPTPEARVVASSSDAAGAPSPAEVGSESSPSSGPDPAARAPETWPTLRPGSPPTLFPGTPLRLVVTVEGGTVACRPELYISPRGASRYGRHLLEPDGDGRWTGRVQVPYGEEFQGGAEYFFTCCLDGRCEASAGSRAHPLVAEAADL